MKKRLSILGLVVSLFICLIPTLNLRFFLFSSLGVFLYKVFAVFGLLLFLYFLSNLIKRKMTTLFIILIGLEIGIIVIIFLIQKGVNFPTVIDINFRNCYVRHFRNTIQYDSNLAQYNSDLYYTLRPGKGIFKGREFADTFHINSLGVRDDEESLINPEIIFIGDSFTMGWGVSQEVTFTQLVEKQSNVKTLNMGISSYSTAREYLLLKKINYSSTKLIVVQFCSNDVLENKQFAEKGKLNISLEENYEEIKLRNDLNVSYYPFKYFFEFVAKIPREIFSEKKEVTELEKSSSKRPPPKVVALVNLPPKGVQWVCSINCVKFLNV